MATKGKNGSQKLQPKQPGQPIYEDFHPSIEWTQDPANHVLRVYLPDFNKEHIRVQVDGFGKLIVRGLKLESIGRYKRLEESYEVPNDSIFDKISGRFEDGCLTLIMPRKMVEQEGVQKTISSKDENGEKTKMDNSQKKEPHDEKKDVEENKEQQKSPSYKEMKGEGENKEVPAETFSYDEEKEAEKKEEPQMMLQSNVNSQAEEKKEETLRISSISDDKKEEESYQKEKRRSNKFEEYEENAKTKQRIFWNKGVDEEWLGYGLVDNLLERINKNKKVIFVAVTAFSLGFYVSHKLKLCRG